MRSSSVYDTLYQWARRTSAWAELHFLPHEEDKEEASTASSSGLAYRLKHWPELPSATKKAPVLRALSVMSHRPVNRQWLVAHAGIEPRAVDKLLAQLEAQGALDVTDTAIWRQAA